MSHRNGARQHKVAEVACYRLERDTAGGTSDTPVMGGWRTYPLVYPLKLTKNC